MTGAAHGDVAYTRFCLHPIVDHFPYSEECTVGPQFNGSAAIKFDGKGN